MDASKAKMGFILIVISIILISFSLAIIPDIFTSNEGPQLQESLEIDELESKDHETWWILADVHLNQGSNPFMDTEYTGELSNSIEDINNNVDTDRAIILGDLVYEDRSDIDLLESKMIEYENDWTYVLGNHDFDDETPVKEVNYFTEVVNGFRIIAISDEDPNTKHLFLGEEQERWLKNTLEADPDIPKIMMSHQEHGILGRIDVLDGWLGEALKNNTYNVISWICGHDHRPSVSENFSDFGYDRIIPGAISGWGPDNHSMTLTISDDEQPKATARFRDHENKEWIEVDGYDRFKYEISELNMEIEGEGHVEVNRNEFTDDITIEYISRNDEKINLSAVPDENYKFSEWIIDDDRKVQEKTLEIQEDSDSEIKVYFEREGRESNHLIVIPLFAGLLSALILWRKISRFQ